MRSGEKSIAHMIAGRRPDAGIRVRDGETARAVDAAPTPVRRR
jgi:hypothetical protein